MAGPNSADSTSPPARRKRSKLKIAGWTLAALVALYAVLGFWVLPTVARGLAENKLAELTGRSVEIRQVAANPFALTLEVEGFAIGGEGATNAWQTPFFAFDRFYANASISSLFALSPILREVTLENPRVRATRGADGRFTFESMLPEGGGGEAAGEPGSPPRIRIGRLRVEGGEAVFVDRATKPAFEARVAPFDIDLRDFATRADRPGEFSMSAETDAGGAFKWSGSLRAFPLQSEGRVELAGVNIGNYAPYFRPMVNFVLEAGARVDAAMDYRFDLRDEQDLLVVRDGSVAFKDVAARLPGAEAPALALRSLSVEGVAASLLGRNVEVGRIRLDGAEVRAARGADGGVNLAKMVAAAENGAPDAPGTARGSGAADAPDASRADPSAERAGWTYAVDSVRVEAVDLAFEDRAVGEGADFAATLERAEVRGLDHDLATPVELEAELSVASGGRFEAEGAAAFDPLDADIAVRLDELALAAFQPYLAEFADLRLASGEAGFEGRVSASPAVGEAAPPRARYRGSFEVAGLEALAARSGEALAGLKSFRLKAIDAAFPPLEVSVEKALIDGPRLALARSKDGDLNWLEALKTGPGAAAGETAEAEPQGAESAAPAPKKPAPEPPVRIGAIEMQNGRFTFVDRSVDPASETAISDATLTTGPYDGASGKPLEFDFSATVNERSKLAVQGALQPGDPAERTSFRIDLDALGVAAFSPYAVGFIGYPLAQGALSLDMDYAIRDAAIEGSNSVVLENLAFGERADVEPAVKAPVKLGVSLLKNRKGVIDLDVPVSGDLSSPEFSLRKVIASTIGNVFTNIASAPFSVLAGVIGGGRSAETLSFVAFDPGDANLAEDSKGKLADLAKALYERPALVLEMSGRFDPEQDRRALARAELPSVIRELRADHPAFPPAESEGNEPGDAAIRAAYRLRVRGADSLAPRASLAAGKSESGAGPDSESSRSKPPKPSAASGRPAEAAEAEAPANSAQPEPDPGAGAAEAEAEARSSREASASGPPPRQASESDDQPFFRWRWQRDSAPEPTPRSQADEANREPRSAADKPEKRSTEASPEKPGPEQRESPESPDAAEAPDLPSVDAMRAALVDSIDISGDRLRALAEAREKAVGAFLADQTQVDLERVRRSAPNSRSGEAQVTFSVEAE